MVRWVPPLRSSISKILKAYLATAISAFCIIIFREGKKSFTLCLSFFFQEEDNNDSLFQRNVEKLNLYHYLQSNFTLKIQSQADTSLYHHQKGLSRPDPHPQLKRPHSPLALPLCWQDCAASQLSSMIWLKANHSQVLFGRISSQTNQGADATHLMTQGKQQGADKRVGLVFSAEVRS